MSKSETKALTERPVRFALPCVQPPLSLIQLSLSPLNLLVPPPQLFFPGPITRIVLLSLKPTGTSSAGDRGSLGFEGEGRSVV